MASLIVGALLSGCASTSGPASQGVSYSGTSIFSRITSPFRTAHHEAALADQGPQLYGESPNGDGPQILQASHIVQEDIVEHVPPAPAEENPYLLDSGDAVRVFVYGQPNLSRTYPIDGAGFISIPLIGTVKARAMTTYQLQRNIAAELRVEYVRDPHVTVEVANYRPFFILGEVRTPGQYPFVNGMTVKTAAAIAGGFTERAYERSVQITRRITGGQETSELGIYELVRPGDTIHVQERFF